MGLNLDLVELMGAPKKVKCPACKKQTLTYFDDYDIECPQVKGSIFRIDLECNHCEHLFSLMFKAELKQII